jgi:hypothetical protein
MIPRMAPTNPFGPRSTRIGTPEWKQVKLFEHYQRIANPGPGPVKRKIDWNVRTPAWSHPSKPSGDGIRGDHVLMGIFLIVGTVFLWAYLANRFHLSGDGAGFLLAGVCALVAFGCWLIWRFKEIILTGVALWFAWLLFLHWFHKM